MDRAVHSKRQTLITVLLVVWVVGQFPWLMALVAGAHGPHEISVTPAGNRVVMMLGHSKDGPTDDHHHDDHRLEFAEKQFVRRSAPSLHLLSTVVSCPLGAACLPVNELILARRTLSLPPIPSLPLLHLRTTVRVV